MMSSAARSLECQDDYFLKWLRQYVFLILILYKKLMQLVHLACQISKNAYLLFV